MPQPTFASSGGIAIVKYGGQPLPNGQGTMAYINLNDRQSWFCQALQSIGHENRQLALGQALFRARSVHLADDWGPLVFILPFKYDENATLGGVPTPVGTVLGNLLHSGEQFLTFDNLTGILCKISRVTNRKMEFEAFPPLWDFDIAFTAKSGWYQDLSSSSLSAQALNSGTVTNVSVTYAGSVFCEPVWTLSIPNTNSAPIQSFRLQNTMSGDDLTITFPGNLAASTTWTITIDASAMTVVDQNGAAYDVNAASFPLLYPPAGTVQQIAATLAPASGTATGCTVSASYTNRWVL